MTLQLSNWYHLVELWIEEFENSEPKKKLILLRIASEVIISTQRMPEYQHYIRGFADKFQALFKKNMP